MENCITYQPYSPHMSIRPFFEHPLIFWGAVAVVPLVVSCAVTVFVRRSTADQTKKFRGWLIHYAVVLFLYIGVAMTGGLILSVLRGIPPGLGFVGTLTYLVGIYAIPLATGTIIYRRFLVMQFTQTESQGIEGRILNRALGTFIVCHLAAYPLIAFAYVLA